MIRKGFLLQIIFMYLFAGNMFAQIKIEGKIVDKTDKPLPFVNVYWKGTTIGTTSLYNGHFTINKTEKSDTLIFSFIGYQTKYVFANRNNIGTVKLKDDMMSIEEVVVTSRRKAEEISKLTPRKTEKLTSASLERLPCCHLAATFENTLSVDKTYTDAVTGTEEIKMLGLAGVYTQILSEEVPVARGLSASLGLHVPGPYLKSVSISKGIGSVISGYEGITGQVQMFLKQPDNSENFFANLYMNSFLSTDINLYKGFEISDKWNSMLFVHGSLHSGEIDNNNDGFLDMPTGKAGNITQTFKYDNKGKYRHQFGYRLTYKDDYGGESEFDKNRDRGTTNFYGVGIINKRYELFSNQMFRIKWIKDVTFGVKTNYAYAENSSFFGLKDYTGRGMEFWRKYITQSYNIW
ncbi:MAG: carboxypeptidase-like regulatory domain-containing protein [Bacteroidales bacterium]|jgi:hypothetical protein|nr:carboxypeptidase-like regulatory domain-containing protein [Bacteroidales bacterium]